MHISLNAYFANVHKVKEK